MKKIFTNKIVVALVAMLCCALWGSAFPVIKIGYKFFNISGVDTASQILFAGVRFLIAGFLTILLGSILPISLLLLRKKKILKKSAFWRFFKQFCNIYFSMSAWHIQRVLKVLF